MRHYFTVLAFLFFVSPVYSQLKLPAFWQDNMVLQQKKINKIWGWTSPGKKVTVRFNNQQYASLANAKGEWTIFMQPAPAGKAGNLIVQSGTDSIVLRNLLSGEVWICSGQSNMEMKMASLEDLYLSEMQQANNDSIRFVTIDRSFSNHPLTDVSLERNWSAITPASIGSCSAVAYWYAKKISREMKVPVGLIISSWGGTPAEAWTSYEGLHDFPHYIKRYDEVIAPLDLADVPEKQAAFKKQFQDSATLKAPFFKAVIQTDFDDAGWKKMHLPGGWEGQGYPTLDGIVVYRLRFTVSAADAGKEAVLNLPAIDDIDSTYINGQFIGTDTRWDMPRTYKVKAGITKAGENVLVIKVQDNGGGGGLSNLPAAFNVIIGKTTIPLEGDATFNIAAVLMDISGGFGDLQHQPATLYNAMIAPLLPLSISGAIWYQGESNADRPKEYAQLFPAMIQDWRNRWGQGDFPFYFVQLASFGAVKTEPAESDWALLRASQVSTLQLPHTGMAVTVDVGNPLDIHPHRKKEVGERLAAAALNEHYGKKELPAGGPLFKSASVKGGQVIISFNQAGKGLVARNGALKAFAIAGADKHFVWATATIAGDKVMVSSPLVKQPVAVRYAWADSPVDANLYNKEGFPASPFRTDDW